jgi:predicted enzyme related to lactoylglutathione lyase
MAMVTRDGYAPGTPSWVDLQSPDVGESVTWYAELFGWETGEASPEGGGYTPFTMRGVPVAGVGPTTEPGTPGWTTYISVEDATRSANLVEMAGGTVLTAPIDVLDVGRMALVADPQGAVFALWQPRAHRGAGLVNEPGGFAWNELLSPDPTASRAFYARVFGWGANTMAMGPTEYTEWTLDGASVGGMMALGAPWPEGTPPRWIVYFSVADCDATAARVTATGGQVMAPPMDIPPGRVALVADPHGAVFYVMKLASPPA